jgi:ketosteroid isomerase-like protein
VSEQNVELQRRLTDAFNARDIEAFIALCDPKVEVHSTFAELGAIYHGHDGVRRWHRDFEDAWEKNIRLEVQSYFDLGEYTLLFSVWHGRGRQSGVDVALPGAQVARWRDGRLVYIKGYTNREDALLELGISEDALEPSAP